MVFPPKCIFCGTLLMHDIDSGMAICAGCLPCIPYLKDTRLRIMDARTGSYCDGAYGICRYEGIIKHSLIKYKFFGKPSYYKVLARLSAERIFKVTGKPKFDMIISVPLHIKREAERGYNQALLLSRAMAVHLDIKECSGLLKKVGHTGVQSLLDKKGRLKNLAGAFKVKAPRKVKGKIILLVDDILTTGATVNECARVLKQAGAAMVYAVVVATGQA